MTLIPCRIAIAHFEPAGNALDPYWALDCVCGYRDTYIETLEALDGAFQHYTHAHDTHQKLFIDMGPVQ